MSYTFKPSKIADEIYNLMEDYIVSSNEYEPEVVPIIEKLFEEKYSNIKFTAEFIGDMNYGVYAISWVEDNEPVLILINYSK